MIGFFASLPILAAYINSYNAEILVLLIILMTFLVILIKWILSTYFDHELISTYDNTLN